MTTTNTRTERYELIRGRSGTTVISHGSSVAYSAYRLERAGCWATVEGSAVKEWGTEEEAVGRLVASDMGEAPPCAVAPGGCQHTACANVRRHVSHAFRLST